MAGAVSPVSELRGEELRSMTRKRWWWLTMVLGPLAVGYVAAAVLSGNPVTVFVLALLAAVAAGLGVTYYFADSSAKSAFVKAWALSRGWTTGDALWRNEATPLLRAGDQRESHDHVCGALTSGDQAVLCHYTYQVESTSTDSKGNTTTNLTEHPFTVVQTFVAARGIPSLTLHPRSLSDFRLFERIDSAMTSHRVVELESSEFEDEYELKVADQSSDVAVRRLFEPAFIVWCVDRASEGMQIELEGDTLVVAIPHHSYDVLQLDGLVDKATTVATRLAEAHETTTQVT